MKSPFPWDHLLDLVAKRRVIPVVGSDLLLVEQNGASRTLEAHCAVELARRLEIEEPSAAVDSFNGLAAAYARSPRGSRTLQEEVFELNRHLERELPIPASLLQLAALPFPLFLTTTFHPLLRRALDEVRFGGQARTRVHSYYPGDRTDDLPESLEGLTGATVVHLLGRLQASPYFAMTDEEILECMIGLQGLAVRDDKGGWKRLFEAISTSSLLLIGTSFSDWLARFFLRIATQQPLSSSRRLDFMADGRLERDEGLVLFLQHFATRTRIFLEGGPVEFVRQLHEHWLARQAAAGPTPDLAPERQAPMERGGVFISYASEDRPAVQALCSVLEAAEIDFWLDRHELGAGDDWRRQIRRNIEEGSCFVAVLSRNCVTSERREFRYEWSLAVEQQFKAPPDLPFILPLAVDDVAESEPRLDPFRALQWEHAPEGRSSRAFVDKLRMRIRAHRAPQVGRP